MVVTAAVSHADTSSLKTEAPLNMLCGAGGLVTVGGASCECAWGGAPEHGETGATSWHHRAQEFGDNPNPHPHPKVRARVRVRRARRTNMEVIAPVSHEELMAPYVVVAAVGLEMYWVTAALRSVVLLKT
jgi:hypothetical protein